MNEAIPVTCGTQRIYESETILQLSKDWFQKLTVGLQEEFLPDQFDMKYDIIKYDIVEQFINRNTNNHPDFDLMTKMRKMIEISPELFEYNNYGQSSNAIIYDQYKVFIQHNSLEYYVRLSRSADGQFYLDKFNGSSIPYPISDLVESSFLVTTFSDIDDVLRMLDKMDIVIKNPNISIIKIFRNF